MLLQKMEARLAGWKSHMLSHAGRLVLIKSVLLSLPVYYMSVECLPKGVIQKMNSLMAKFFWGKIDKKRYMAPLAWKKVCKPVEEGGLGVRDLKKFGESLFMKLVWQTMSGSAKLWTKVCNAKYCPQIGFWDAKPYPNSSAMWRNIMKMKGQFKDQIGWVLGDGSTVKAISQPWFLSWDQPNTAARADRKKVVADLFDFDAGHWKEDVIAELFNQMQVQAIEQVQPKPNLNANCADRLIWHPSKRGTYSVKEGYQFLCKQGAAQQQDARALLWQKMQKWRAIVPKVKVFLWRLISGALMLSQNVHRRINNVSPMCQRCRVENEYEMHCFFFCQGSRAVWFGRRLGLRTQHLPLDIIWAIEQCTTGMRDEDIQEFSYTLWEIWKGRNEEILQNKKFDVVQIQRRIDGWLNTEEREDNVIGRRVQVENEPANPRADRYEYHQNEYQIVVDGSWDTQHRAGWAYIWYQEGCLQGIGYDFHKTTDPFHVEVIAVKESVKMIIMKNPTKVQIFSDCSILVDILNEESWEDLPNWQAMQDVSELLAILQQWRGKILIKHARREAVVHAHLLANEARRRSLNYAGRPRSWCAYEVKVETTLSERFFQRVQEAPP